jgi:DinB superfamily
MPITPDVKDWTWVLDRPCPDCGFDASAFSRDDVASMIRDSAISWQAVLARANVASRANENMWSPLEYGCHVRDVFRLYDRRLALMLTQDNPTFANWDQDATAIDDAYDAQDPAVVAVELDEAAALLADRFDGVTGDQWSRRGRRSDGANFTVESFARYMIHDPTHHLFDVGVVEHGK